MTYGSYAVGYGSFAKINAKMSMDIRRNPWGRNLIEEKA
jgi:hypothetical protein